MRSGSQKNPSPSRTLSQFFHIAISRIGLFALSAVLFAVSHAQAFDLTLAHSYNGGIVYNLSWESVDPSTTDAQVTYYIFQEFGLDGVSGTGSLGNAIHITQNTQFGAGGYGPGGRCFVVISSDSLGGPAFTSDTECHNFVHNLTSEGIARTDGDGTQLGVDQLWTFTYSMDADAYVTAKIYPPTTQFTTDSNGFIVSASSPVVKTLVDVTPRSGELESHTITMEETWDSRNSSGAIVGNGIYYVLFSASLDSGFFNGAPPAESSSDPTPETYLRAGSKFSIPVNIIRILNLATTPITPTSPTSNISYNLTGDANVRVLIVLPGSGFTLDSNGDIQPLNLISGLIDNSLVVTTFTFQRSAGANVETWDGTYSTGSAVTSGVYPIGLSARDDYGNHAVDNSGNDYPIFTVITVEKSAGSSGGGSSDTTAPSLTSITPTDGSTSNSPVSAITIVLSDSGSAIDLVNCSVSVLDPNSTVVSGVTTNNGSNTLTFTPTTPLQTGGGPYTVTIIAVDVPANSATYVRTFSVNIRLDSDELKSSLQLYPNPAKNTTATISYDLAIASTVDIDIFNVLGERVYSATFSDGQGVITHTWDLKNSSGKKVGSGLYLVRIKAKGSGGEAEAIKKLVVVQ